MKKTCIVALLWLSAVAQAQEVSQVWNPNLRGGEYRNPVICADYSDPDVIRVGDDYWLTSSSFNCVPALQILHSADLVNWEFAGAVGTLPEPHFDTVRHGGGVWAPSIRFHDGKYYIYWGDPDAGIYMVQASSPRGEWSAPHLVVEGKGLIDPCPLWDDDGRAYLVHAWAGSRSGRKSILCVAEMAPDGRSLIGDEVLVFDGHDANPTVEGPKFYKRNGYYYIFAPAGGVKEGWQLVLRSDSPMGHYESRRVMAQGSTTIHGPHQGGWVTDIEGESWFLHFEDRYAYGRVVHLQPVTWDEEGWCIIGIDNDGDGVGEPVERYRRPASKSDAVQVNPAENDSFDGHCLGLQWQWQANPQRHWYVWHDGRIRLYCEPYTDIWTAPNLLLQKLSAPTLKATARLSFRGGTDGDRAGVIVMGRDYATLCFVREGGKTFLVQTRCTAADKGGIEEEVARVEIADTEDVRLRIEVGEKAVCRFMYSADGRKYRPLGEGFTAKEGVWIGAKIGLFAVTSGHTNDGGWCDVDHWQVEPL